MQCRRILTYKYRLGLNKRPVISVDGLSDRINTPEARALLTNSARQQYRTGELFRILPLVKDEIAVLTVGGEGSDALFIEELRTRLSLKTFRMDKDTGEEERKRIAKELGKHRRVIVSMTIKDKEAEEYRPFFMIQTSISRLLWFMLSLLRTGPW